MSSDEEVDNLIPLLESITIADLPAKAAHPIDIDPLFSEKTLVLQQRTALGLLEFFPTACTKDYQDCQIHPKGTTSQKYCYDFPSPMLLQIPLFYCRTHQKQFSLLSMLHTGNVNLVANVLLHDFGCTLATHKFIKYVYDQLPDHCFNFAALQRSIVKLWMSAMEEKILIAQAHAQIGEQWDQERATKVIVSRMDLSTKQLSKIYIHHWKVSGADEYNSYMSALHQLTGETLRIDHTYKITRSITAYSTDLKKRVAIKSSLFSILNEYGHIMATSIVPNDCRSYFYPAFQSIWIAEGRDESQTGIKTKFVYTDDVRKDTSTILDIYNTIHCTLEPPLVLQDVWHAIQRVDKLLDKNHPDYKAAKGCFSTIFNNIQNQAYDSSASLKSELLLWQEKYSALSSRSAIPLNDLINQLGKAIKAQTTVFLTPDGKAFDPVVSDKVVAAIENLIEEPVLSGLFNISKHTNGKQGTSQNEIWHKNIGKKFSQLSNSVSLEVLSVFLCHMALQYNQSKDNAHLWYKQLLSQNVILMLELPTAKVLVTYMDVFKPARYELLKQAGFTHKKFTPAIVAKEHVDQCKLALLEIANKRGSITQRSLLYYIQHHFFSGTFSKSYVKQLVYAVLKQFNAQPR